METRTQISVFLENKPGTLERVAMEIGGAKINILGFSVSDAIDHAVVRMVVDDARKAVHLLGEAGMLVLEADVLELKLTNTPGALAKVAAALKGAGININYAYGSNPTGGDGVLYLNTTDPAKARRVLDQIKA